MLSIWQPWRLVQNLAVKISALVHETQKERGASAGFLGSKGSEFGEALKTQRRKTDARIGELREFIISYDSGRLREVIEPIVKPPLDSLETIEDKRNEVDALRISTDDAI